MFMVAGYGRPFRCRIQHRVSLLNGPMTKLHENVKLELGWRI